MKKDMFETVCRIVSESCEVDRVAMLCCRTQICVEARSMLVRSLLDVGFKEGDVATYSGLTRQCVNKLKNTFDLRMRDWGFRQMWKDVSNKMSTMLQ
jgi:hypothetical protein